MYVENCLRALENSEEYSSFSAGLKKSRRTTIVRGGKPRSSARSSFVRRNIMRSSRILSFLKAVCPGFPASMPYRAMGVRI